MPLTNLTNQIHSVTAALLRDLQPVPFAKIEVSVCRNKTYRRNLTFTNKKLQKFHKSVKSSAGQIKTEGVIQLRRYIYGICIQCGTVFTYFANEIWVSKKSVVIYLFTSNSSQNPAFPLEEPFSLASSFTLLSIPDAFIRVALNGYRIIKECIYLLIKEFLWVLIRDWIDMSPHGGVSCKLDLLSFYLKISVKMNRN